MPKNVTVDELKAKAKELRLNIIKTANYAGSGHVGGSLSAADVLAALYFKYLNVDKDNPDMFERDRFILSKGHCPAPTSEPLFSRGSSRNCIKILQIRLPIGKSASSCSSSIPVRQANSR